MAVKSILRNTLVGLSAGLTGVIVFSSYSVACDLHSTHDGAHASALNEGQVLLGLSEQFSYFGRVQQSGRYVPNDGQQHLASSVTQFRAGYGVSEEVSLFLQAPLISRRYRRIEDGQVDRGIETGLGDIQLLAVYAPVNHQLEDGIVRFQVFGGVKLPTGDTDQLRGGHHHSPTEGEHDPENDHDIGGEADHSDQDSDMHEHHRSQLRHGGIDHGEDEAIPSAIHGHELTLGTGSVDVPLGFNLYARYGFGFIRTDFMYTFRNEGDHQYEFADDLRWAVGPGVYLSQEQDQRIAVSAQLSGEYKREDESGGVEDEDSALRAVYLGPRLSFVSGGLAADLGVDLPVDIQNSGFQAVLQYRLRADVSYRF